jgi:hypothetical protein
MANIFTLSDVSKLLISLPLFLRLHELIWAIFSPFLGSLSERDILKKRKQSKIYI